MGPALGSRTLADRSGGCTDGPPSPSQRRASLGTPAPGGDDFRRPSRGERGGRAYSLGDRRPWGQSAAVSGVTTRSPVPAPRAGLQLRRAGPTFRRPEGDGGRRGDTRTRASRIDRALRRQCIGRMSGSSSGAVGGLSRRSRSGLAPHRAPLFPLRPSEHRTTIPGAVLVPQLLAEIA